MIPVIAGSGSSFLGAFQYYCHDKNAQTTARVAWTETVNLLTDCAEKASKVMAFTAKHAARLKEAAGVSKVGKKPSKPVFAYSLSWHPEQSPSKETMLDAAHETLERLGLSEHQALIAAHNDQPQPHCHVVVCRTHPLTGKSANLDYSKRVLSDFAREYEQREGKIYCERRVENYEKRQRGGRTKHGDPVIQEAWDRSTTGREFAALLKAGGYALAEGRKRFVLVDPYGKALNPVRLLADVRAKDFQARVFDLDPKQIPTVKQVLESRESSQVEQHQSLDSRKERNEASKNQTKPGDGNKGIPIMKETFDEVARAGAEGPAETDRPDLVKLRENHFREQDRPRTRHQNDLKCRTAELNTHFRVEEKAARLGYLREKLDRQGTVRRALYTWFGFNRSLERDIASAVASHVEAQTKVSEAVSAIQSQHQREHTNICNKQSLTFDSQRERTQRSFRRREQEPKPLSLQ